MTKLKYEFNEKVHAILINPYLSLEDFNANCELIKNYNIKNITTTLNFLFHLKKAMSNHKVKINALISYPLSDLPFSFINELISYAKDQGANGIEYCPNFFNLSKNNFDTFASELEIIKNSELPSTIIINKTKLDQELFKKAIEISLELGIENFQLGDGFGSYLSSQEILKLLKLIGNQNFIKVVGGIKKLTQVIDLFDLGITCVGTSNYYDIFKEIKVF